MSNKRKLEYPVSPPPLTRSSMTLSQYFQQQEQQQQCSNDTASKHIDKKIKPQQRSNNSDGGDDDEPSTTDHRSSNSKSQNNRLQVGVAAIDVKTKTGRASAIHPLTPVRSSTSETAKQLGTLAPNGKSKTNRPSAQARPNPVPFLDLSTVSNGVDDDDDDHRNNHDEQEPKQLRSPTQKIGPGLIDVDALLAQAGAFSAAGRGHGASSSSSSSSSFASLKKSNHLPIIGNKNKSQQSGVGQITDDDLYDASTDGAESSQGSYDANENEDDEVLEPTRLLPPLLTSSTTTTTTPMKTMDLAKQRST
jgi:hypothetical protein